MMHRLRRRYYSDRRWLRYCLRRLEWEAHRELLRTLKKLERQLAEMKASLERRTCPACGELDCTREVVDCFDERVGGYWAHVGS